MAITADSNWREDAACATVDLHVPFGSDRDEDEPCSDRDARKFAREVCGNCPVIFECREFAKKHNVTHGVFGGLTPSQRGLRFGTD